MTQLANKLANRQMALVFLYVFTVDDFRSTEGGKTANVIDIPMPVDAVLLSGHVAVLDAIGTTGTDVLDVGDSASANRYKNDINLKSAALTALVPTGYRMTSSTDAIRLTRVPADEDAADGDGSIEVALVYAVNGKGGFTQD